MRAPNFIPFFKALLAAMGIFIISLYWFTPPFFAPFSPLAIALGWGYMWGSFVGGPLFAKIFHLGDLRKIGSGNVGTTNVLRTGHKPAAFLTLGFDTLKALIAVYTLPYLLKSFPFLEAYSFLTALGACLGHLFPVWLNFKGGKGIATLAGVTFAFSGLLALSLITLWGTIAYISRYSSFAGILTLLAAIPLAYFFKGQSLMWFYISIAPLILWRHKDNIQRLIQGNEPKIGNKCSTPASST